VPAIVPDISASSRRYCAASRDSTRARCWIALDRVSQPVCQIARHRRLDKATPAKQSWETHEGEPSMPLTRGKIVGHDSERLAFGFTMQSGDETVECQISDAAMDELAGVKGTQSIARQAQFVSHRDAIEQIASDLFDGSTRVKGAVIRIFTKHVQQR
jgi:hypothetical protein